MPSRSAFLNDLLSQMASNTAFTAAIGTDSDMAIESNPVDTMWGTGDKRIDYSAVLKAVESDGTVYLWEMLKERTTGFSYGTFDSESNAAAGTRKGASAHPPMGPGSPSWEWGFGTLRPLVEQTAVRHGFVVREVLTRRAACW
jgi:hypothetical protein